ncbi:MAG: MinD/ParA family protein [Syntrophales bacterium]|nr:MinD/ParA family protein [Syntrophales bacterium]
MDQASALREMKKGNVVPVRIGRGPQRDVRVIAITSGKGGVGKTNIAANLGYVLATMKKKTMVLDADMGLANLDLILGLTPKFNLCHVLRGEKTLKETIVEGPGGMMILPASSGIQELAEMSSSQKMHLLDEMSTLENTMDFILIDTGAGIASNVMYFNAAAREIIVIVTPEPTSMTDAYALMKILYQKHSRKRFRLIVNMAQNVTEAKAVYQRLSVAMGHFLSLGIEYLGFIPRDDRLQDAVRIQKPIAAAWPTSPASKNIRDIARLLCNEEPDHEGLGGVRFFWESIGM